MDARELTLEPAQIADSVRQIGDNVFALGTSGHNFYLLVDGAGVTIIDSGCSGEWVKLIAGLRLAGRSLNDVVGVIITHSHADHFGMAQQMQDTGLEVSVHEDEESRALGTYQGRYAVTPSELPKFNIYSLRTFLPMIIAGILRVRHVGQIGTFEDGETLDLPGGPVAIHTPGHTEGHTMFHCPDLGLLFTGDGLVTMDLIGAARGPQMIERRFNLDHDQAHQSLDRIVDIDAEMLLPGHGLPWKISPSEAVEMVRS